MNRFCQKVTIAYLVGHYYNQFIYLAKIGCMNTVPEPLRRTDTQFDAPASSKLSHGELTIGRALSKHDDLEFVMVNWFVLLICQ